VPGPGPRTLLRRWLGGESFIAATGLVLAAVMVGVVCVSAWWGMRTQHTAIAEAAHQRARVVAGVLAGAAESALQIDRPADLRSQAVGAVATGAISACRVRLADGSILLSTSPEPMAKRPPGEWPAWAAPPAGAVTEAGGSVRVEQPIRVPGKGLAVLELEAPAPVSAFGHGQAETGIAAAGVVGMLLVWWAYRGLRRKLRVLGAIRESLLAAAEGEASSAALAVASGFGPEAEGWNALLRTREAALLSEAESLATDRRRGGGDTAGGASAEGLDCLWQGVLLLDESMRTVYANGAAAVLLRLRREDLVGRPLEELFPEENARAALAGVSAGTVKHRVQWEVERRAEGASSAVVRVSVKPARKGDRFAALALVEDVSQQRVADKSRNALIAQASHELRTPLTNIRLYAEALLEDQGENPSARATAINVINQESRRLERIVADMLSVSEIEAGSFRLRRDDVPIGSILEDLRQDFAPQAQDKEIRLVFEVAPKLPAFSGDRDKITLALHNLLGNAIKYTPAGGSVTVRAMPENPGTPAETLVVEVADTGIGVRPEEQELIFDRFYRSADKRIASITGTGLGLTLSREVARLHGGDVTLKSAINEGSTFTFRIPATPESAARRAA
jgi:PAS domain S-box-containing protein